MRPGECPTWPFDHHAGAPSCGDGYSVSGAGLLS